MPYSRGLFGIAKPFLWVAKALGPTPGAPIRQPDSALRTVRPSVDLLGWQRLGEPVRESQAAGNASSVQADLVPAREARLYIAVEVTHDDVGAPHSLSIEGEWNRALANHRVALRDHLSRASGEAVTIDRPIVMFPGDRLRGVSVDAVGVGNTLLIDMVYIVLEEGEYVPWL